MSVIGIVSRIIAVDEGFWTTEYELDTGVIVGIGGAAVVEGCVELGSTILTES